MKKAIRSFFICALAMTLCACGMQSQIASQETTQEGAEKEAESFQDFVFEKAYDNQYATGFLVEKYKEYELITIYESNQRFLLIPEGTGEISDIPKDIVLIHTPLNNVYMVASAAFDFVSVLDSLDTIALSGSKADNLYIEEAKQRVEDGRIAYAGKYNMPDYELLVSSGCTLAIENTMIFHSPETKEKLETMGIPVLVECSSREAHPLGRLEWIKLYGTLFGKEEEAITYFDEQTKNMEEIFHQEKTGVTVAFFYINGNGAANVRRPGDYVSKMIELSGGEYILQEEDEKDESSMSTMNMQVEDFYLKAKDADIIIYNGIMDGGIRSKEDLISLNPLFTDFKAVKNDKVFCTDRDFYQEITGIGRFMEDLNIVIRGGETDFNYLTKVK